MTKRERAQVVELLRCVHGSPLTVRECACALGATAAVYIIADDASWSVFVEMQSRTDAESMSGDERYDLACLEAAARVEERSWP